MPAPRFRCMWNPWGELRALTNVVFAVTADLPSGNSWWSPRHDVILMKPGLLQVERRCALAHELGHRTLGHSGECGHPDAGRQNRRQEMDADLWAARRLITLDALARVVVWTDDRGEAAEELWVTRHILDVRLEHMHLGERLQVRNRILRAGDHQERGTRA